jgi:ATP-dependent Clp protease adaptor protein ClpS
MSEPKIKIRIDETVKEPSKAKVIYLNDDKTPMDFVISSLMKYFKHDEDAAYNLTMDVHEKGSAVVAVLPYEIAETRGVSVTTDARALGHPLVVKIQQE